VVLLSQIPDQIENLGEKPQRTVQFDVPLTIRVNLAILKRLWDMAEFQNAKPATLAREILLEKIETGERNPGFKKFLRDREQRKAKEKRLEGAGE
jgi:hypothetical protein